MVEPFLPWKCDGIPHQKTIFWYWIQPQSKKKHYRLELPVTPHCVGDHRDHFSADRHVAIPLNCLSSGVGQLNCSTPPQSIHT